MLHEFGRKNKSVKLHEFGRKTKVSYYMSLEEKQKCHVTCGVWKKNKSVMLHAEFGRKTKLSCYIGLKEKQKCYRFERKTSVML